MDVTVHRCADTYLCRHLPSVCSVQSDPEKTTRSIRHPCSACHIDSLGTEVSKVCFDTRSYIRSYGVILSIFLSFHAMGSSLRASMQSVSCFFLFLQLPWHALPMRSCHPCPLSSHTLICGHFSHMSCCSVCVISDTAALRRHVSRTRIIGFCVKVFGDGCVEVPAHSVCCFGCVYDAYDVKPSFLTIVVLTFAPLLQVSHYYAFNHVLTFCLTIPLFALCFVHLSTQLLLALAFRPFPVLAVLRSVALCFSLRSSGLRDVLESRLSFFASLFLC